MGGYVSTIVSDWSDWPLYAVESADPETVTIWYLDYNGFTIKGSEGTTLFADPYIGIGDPPWTVCMILVPFGPKDMTEAGAVLITHEHTDHAHGQNQMSILENTGATFVTPDDPFSVTCDDETWFDDCDLFEDQFEGVVEGDSVDTDEFTVYVEPVYDLDASHPVAYVSEHELGTFIHGGDTKSIEELVGVEERYDFDLGILVFGTIDNISDKETGGPVHTMWYNDEGQIIEITNDLDPDHLISIRQDTWKGMIVDPRALRHHAKSFKAPRSLDLAEIGDRVNL